MLRLSHRQALVAFNLPEENVAKVRSVDCRVAESACLYVCGVVRSRSIHHRESGARRRPEVGCGVALQAEQVDVAVLQHVRIRSSVWDMAGRATLQSHRGVFVHEWSLLILVAFEASDVARIRILNLMHHVVGFPILVGSVLVVAVAALNQALIHAMVKRHIELGFLLQVAGVAKFRLGLHQQVFRRRRMVRRMAVRAANLILPVERIRGVDLAWSGCVARQTARVDIRGGSLLENK